LTDRAGGDTLNVMAVAMKKKVNRRLSALKWQERTDRHLLGDDKKTK